MFPNIKSRIGDDASRFPTKKHLCSYAGVVPGADNSGEHESEHQHVKHGDVILKYALTCAASGAVKAKTDSAVKRIYLKQIKRGKAAQEAQVAAAIAVYNSTRIHQRNARYPRTLDAVRFASGVQEKNLILQPASQSE